MANDIAIFIIFFIAVAIGTWVFTPAMNFITEVPKQLKRIADSLERRDDDGKWKRRISDG